MSISNRSKRLIRRCCNACGFDIRRIRPKSSRGLPKSSNFNEEDIIKKLLETVTVEHHFCVDIGAADGESMSNSYPLFRAGWQGLAVEFDGDSFAKLAFRYGSFKNACLARLAVTPDNILDIFVAYGVPKEFGFLSLDIDGYDYFVLEKILSAYRPSVVCVEINTVIPPPVKFTVTYSEKYAWNGGHFCGQSIAMVEDLAIKNKYDIVALEFNNLFLVPRELNRAPALTAAEAYKKGYLDRSDRLDIYPPNREMEPLQHQTPAEVVAYLKNYFKKYEGQFTIR